MTIRNTDKLRSVIRLGWESGLPHVVLALISIQGAAYIVQFAIAHLVSPGEFGIVRTVEATFSISLVIASAGLPSLAIKSVATMQTLPLQGRLLRRLVGLVIGTSLITAIVVAAVARFIVAPSAAPWLMGLVFALVPVAVARTCINFFQALRAVKRISLVVAAGSVIGVAAVIGLVSRYGLAGWLTGRYLAESLLAGIALLLCWRYLRSNEALPASVRRRSLLLEGSTVSSSLLVRSAIDNLPVLSLGWFAIAATDVGYFGLGSLAAAAFLLTPGAMTSLAIAPMVSALRHGPGAARHLFVRLQTASAIMTVPLTLGLIVVLPALLRMWAPAYLPGVGVLRVLLAVVPLRAATTISGLVLLAADRISTSLWLNIATLALCLGTLSVLVPRHGVAGAAGAIVLAETASAAMFFASAARCFGAPLVASRRLMTVPRQELMD